MRQARTRRFIVSTLDNRTTVITPLIPSKPRLRFMTDAGLGAAGDADAAAQAAATALAAKNAADAAAAAAKPPWGDDPTKFDPNKAWTLIENLRGEVAAAKGDKTELTTRLTAAETKFNQFAQGLGGLLGFEAPETDPEKLQAKVTDLSTQITEKDSTITKAQADLKAANLSTQVAILGGPLGANIPLLLNNEEFKTSIASVEPTDGAALTAAITKALQANAALKQPPTRSGAGEHTGPTIQTLESQLKAAQEKKDLVETIRLKQAIAAARKA